MDLERKSVVPTDQATSESRGPAPGKRPAAAAQADTPSVTPELTRALEGERGTPLADSPGQPVDESSNARIVTGPVAAEAARSICAQAFTVGDRIFFGEGQYQPGTHHGDDLLRHELGHVAQQRGATVPAIEQLTFTEPGSAEERAADHAAAGGSAGSASAGSARIARRIDDYEARQERQVGGNTYTLLNDKDLYYAFGHRFVEMPLPSPSPFLTWSQGQAKFLEAFVFQMRSLGGGDYSGWADIARHVVMPEDFRELINRGRVLFGTKKDDQTGEEFATGPQRFQDASALPLVHAIHRRLVDSLGRMVPRFLAAQNAADQANREPDPNTIAASHPCDYVLIQTLVLSSQRVEVDLEAYRQRSAGAGGAETDYQLGDADELDWQFVDHGNSPNWIQVNRPAGATAELVAMHLYGSPQEATRLVASPPYFGLPMESARELRQKKGLSTDHWALVAGASFMPWMPGSRQLSENARDPAFGLLRSGVVDDAALAEAGSGEVAGTGADRGSLLRILERTRYALSACADLAAPFGMVDNLTEPITYLDGRLAHFAGAPDEDVQRWFVHSEKQDDVVARAAMGLDTIERHLRAMGVTELSQMAKVPRVVRVPLDRVAQQFVDAAVLSRLPATAEQRVARAELDLQLAPLETIELILRDVQTRVYALRQINRKHHPNKTEWDYGEQDLLYDEYHRNTPDDQFDPEWQPANPEPYSNSDAGGRLAILQQEVAAIRGKIVAGDSNVGPLIQELYQKVDRLSLETEIAQGHAFLGQAIADVDQAGDDDWTMVAEGMTGDLFRASDTAFEGEMYRFTFEQAWDYYQMGKPEEARRILVEDLGQNEHFKTYLQRAYDTIDDMATKAMILKIATLVGIVLVTMGFGAVAEGIAGTAGAGEVGAFIAGATVEAASFTALDHAIFGNDDVAGTMAVEFGTNLATFGLLRAWRLRKAATAADEAMATARLDNATRMEKVHGYLLQGKELTGQGLLIAATSYAQMQVDSLRQRGEFVSLSEMREMGKQGLAMVLGIAVGGRVFREQFDELRRLGAAAGEDLGSRLQSVRDLARAVEDTRRPDLAVELLRQDRALIETELELRQRLDQPDGQPASAPAPDAAIGTHLRMLDQTELTLALDEVVPGRVYMGTSEQLAPMVTRLEENGATVRRIEDDGHRRYEIEDGDRRYTLREASHYSTRSGGEIVPARTRQTFEPDSVVGHVSSVDQGRNIMRRLVGGDRTALAELGHDGFPPDIETNRVEWGLARRWDGALAVVLGGFQDIDWSKLPHMKPLSHTHPMSSAAALRGTDGDGIVRIDQLGDLSNDLTHLFPSAADFSVMARGNIRNHVVHTPYVDRGGGRIGNPVPGETGATVDFVIHRSTYVGRWAGAEDLGVYRATVSARTPDGVIWRGEIYAIDAGGSMLYRSRPPISPNRLPAPKPRFETQSGAISASLVAKLEAAGVPSPNNHPDVARVLGAMDADTRRWTEDLLDLEQAGRVRGVREWFDGLLEDPSGPRVGNMLIEIREARRLVDERPDATIDLGADRQAPMKPGSTTDRDKSFDFEMSTAGAVDWSVEIKTYGEPVSRPQQIGKTIDATVSKLVERSDNGQPIPGQHELRIDVRLFRGQARAGGHARFEYDGTGGRRFVDGQGNLIPRRDNPGNILDEMVGYLNGKAKAQELDRLTLVDAGGVLAVYDRHGGTWARSR